MSGPTLSVIVPFHNEEAYLRSCIDALVGEGSDIDEVVLVDNRSVDASRAIADDYARRFANIRVVSESEQGLVFARNRGFDEATGDVYARIDADTRVHEGWAGALREYFGRPDTQAVGAVTGLNDSYDSPYRALKRAVLRFLVARGWSGGERPMVNVHGANMALRADAWKTVRDRVRLANDVHEDLDLALCLVTSGYRIAQLDSMWADVSPRRAYTNPIEFFEHTRATMTTVRLHGAEDQRVRVSVAAHWLAHVVVWMAYRPYDPRLGRFSFRAAVRGVPSRGLAVG